MTSPFLFSFGKISHLWRQILTLFPLAFSVWMAYNKEAGLIKIKRKKGLI